MIKDLEEVILENKNFIYKIASKYSKHYNIEDLFQVGTIGFIKAYKNYKESNTKFTTYAYKYVLGEIIEYIKNDRNMKVSSDMLKLYKSYVQTKEYLSHEYSRCVSTYEVSAYLRVDEQILNEAILKSEFAVSLERDLNDDNFTLEKIIGFDRTNTIDDLIDLKNELNSLTPYERKIIELRYLKDYTQSETATILGLSQVQVSREESKVLKKIRSNITV